jgi:hypothetical protein
VKGKIINKIKSDLEYSVAERSNLSPPPMMMTKRWKVKLGKKEVLKR